MHWAVYAGAAVIVLIIIVITYMYMWGSSGTVVGVQLPVAMTFQEANAWAASQGTPLATAAQITAWQAAGGAYCSWSWGGDGVYLVSNGKVPDKCGAAGTNRQTPAPGATWSNALVWQT